MDAKDLIKRFRVQKKKISLKRDFDPGYAPKGLTKESAQLKLSEGIGELANMQDRLYADNRHSLLCIFQAMDAAGKDSTIKHVLSGLNPQGCQVFSFKVPTHEELDHDYLWRYWRCLPERGRIGIFNRSYFEEVLVVRVHQEILERQRLPDEFVTPEIWNRRYEDINNFERHLVENGTVILKFFLNVSKEEQKARFIERIDNPKKNWKFAAGDVKERKHWVKYQQAYENMLEETSTKWAPWYVIPADKKWFTRLAVSTIISARVEELNPSYPKITPAQKRELAEAKAELLAE